MSDSRTPQERQAAAAVAYAARQARAARSRVVLDDNDDAYDARKDARQGQGYGFRYARATGHRGAR